MSLELSGQERCPLCGSTECGCRLGPRGEPSRRTRGAPASIWLAVRPMTIGTYRIPFWRNLRSFLRDSAHGRPCICHSCGEPMYAGQWIQRVRVPALPWTMWRHRSYPCGPGHDRV